jgi:parvulin-like peptidyl-prolyl isomerase
MRCTSLLALCLLAAPALAQKSKPAKPAAPGARKSGPDLPSRAPSGAPIATVNGERIPMSLYIDRLSLAYGPQIREALIEEALISQEAKRRKISVSAAEIDATVSRTFQDSVRRFGDQEKLAAELARTRGWTVEDYRSVIRSQAPAQTARQKLAEALVKPAEIKDADVEKRYEEQKQTFTQPDSVRMSHILIRRGSDEEKDRAAKTRAEELLKKVQAAKGANFEQIARESSEDRITGPEGGKVPIDIGRGAHPFGAAFDSAVFGVPSGVVEEVIASPDGYRIVRVDQKKEGRVVPLAEVKEQVRAALLQERRAQALDELFVRLRTQAAVETGKF